LTGFSDATKNAAKINDQRRDALTLSWAFEFKKRIAVPIEKVETAA